MTAATNNLTRSIISISPTPVNTSITDFETKHSGLRESIDIIATNNFIITITVYIHDESIKRIDQYCATLNDHITVMGVTIDSNVRDSDNDTTLTVKCLTQKVNSVHTITHDLHGIINTIQHIASTFQQTSLDRIVTSMAEFGNIANEAE